MMCSGNIMQRSGKSHGLHQGHPQWIGCNLRCGVCILLSTLSGEKATGLAVLKFLLVESILSPRFWIVGVLLFGLFFAASRGSAVLRVVFFWIPTLTVSALGFSIVAIYAYLFTISRHQ